jgi:hypothetical protein
MSPISIAGSGTITGISAGGLPDDCITTAEIAANAVTYAKIGTTEQGQLCKAWVNFNGTGTVAIRASFNVSSITDNGVGNYTVNFTTAMVDANYVVTALQTSFSTGDTGGAMYVSGAVGTGATLKSTSQVRVLCFTNTITLGDYAELNVAIFR